jgi:hypothetical protein
VPEPAERHEDLLGGVRVAGPLAQEGDVARSLGEHEPQAVRYHAFRGELGRACHQEQVDVLARRQADRVGAGGRRGERCRPRLDAFSGERRSPLLRNGARASELIALADDEGEDELARELGARERAAQPEQAVDLGLLLGDDDDGAAALRRRRGGRPRCFFDRVELGVVAEDRLLEVLEATAGLVPSSSLSADLVSWKTLSASACRPLR